METINAENKFKYIIPPLSRKAIIDKTAKFVAVHGRQIEEGMLNQAKEKTAASFTFLLEDDPYHGYYLAKIQENIDNPNAAQQ